MSFLRVQTAGNELLIIFLYITRRSLHQQFITIFHLDHQRVQGCHRIARLRHDRFIGIRQFRQIMAFDLRVNTKFHLLGVNHHELQFGRMLLIQQRGDNRIQADRFTLPGRTRHQQVGSLAQVEHEHFVDNRPSDRHRQVIRTFLEFARSDHRLHRNSLRFIIRDLDPDRSFSRHRRDNTDLQG